MFKGWDFEFCRHCFSGHFSHQVLTGHQGRKGWWQSHAPCITYSLLPNVKPTMLPSGCGSATTCPTRGSHKPGLLGDRWGVYAKPVSSHRALGQAQGPAPHSGMPAPDPRESQMLCLRELKVGLRHPPEVQRRLPTLPTQARSLPRGLGKWIF